MKRAWKIPIFFATPGVTRKAAELLKNKDARMVRLDHATVNPKAFIVCTCGLLSVQSEWIEVYPLIPH